MFPFDTTVAHPARVYNYWLGGKDNFAVDRAVGEQILASRPELADSARLSRAYLIRAVRYLAGEAGIRQFLDVGTGLPTVENTHEVAQRVAPESRVVYVDNDRVVGYGETGRAKLTTLTKEFFMPGFLERDEGEREPACDL